MKTARSAGACLSRSILIAIVAGLSTLTVAGEACAQGQSPVDLYIGYATLDWNDLDYWGWQAAVAVNVRTHLQWVTDVSGNYRNHRRIEGVPVDFNLAVHDFATGARFPLLRVGNVSPFVQLLLGGMRAQISANATPGVPEASRIKEITDAVVVKVALHPATGATWSLTDRLGVRGLVEYRKLFHDSLQTSLGHQLSTSVGVVVSFGTR